MIDFDQLDPAVIIARGQYSTVRSAHEDALKDLHIACSKFTGFTTGILRATQPDKDQSFPGAEDFDKGRELIDEIEKIVANIEELHKQKNSLKALAWG